MEEKSGKGSVINKPTQLASRAIGLLGFINPEDLIYKLTQDYFQYLNYGMFAATDSPDYGERGEEEVNYLELFNLSSPVLGNHLDILEIGCGFGHGAQLIYEEFNPNYLLSIDRARNAIHYAQNNLDSTQIDFKHESFSESIAPAESFDVIYTVESGGRFPKQESFEAAYRLLKKNGVFLVANVNPTNEIEKKRKYAEQAGFRIYREKDVTQQVLSYLNSDKKARKFYSAIDKMPFYKSFLWKLFMKQINEFARMPGSKAHALLGSREFYYHFCFRKP